MSENNDNNYAADSSASQPTPEIFTDATGRFLNNNNNPESPQKVYSASQPEASLGILKKGRKSLNGRRVSFAATAHVRVFGNEEKAAEEARLRKEAAEEAEEAEEQRQLEEFRKQFTNDPVDAMKESFNEFDIKSSPLVSNITAISNGTNATPSKRPFTSIDQSFDGKVYTV